MYSKLYASVGLLVLLMAVGCHQYNPEGLDGASVGERLSRSYESARIAMALSAADEQEHYARPRARTDLHSGYDQAFAFARMADPFIKMYLSSDMVAQVLTEERVVAKGDGIVTYLLDRSICSLEALAHAGSVDWVKTCEVFFVERALITTVRNLPNQELNFELSLRAKGQDTHILTLKSAPFLLSFKVTFDVLDQLPDFLAEFDGVPARHKGSITFAMRFDSDENASGCKNGAPACLALDIDEPIDLLIENASGGDFFKLEASAVEGPVFFASWDEDKPAEIALNMGRIEATTPKGLFSMQGLAGQFRLERKGAANITVIQNLSAKNAPIRFNQDDFNLEIKLGQDLPINATVTEEGIKRTLSASAFDIRVLMGSKKEGCSPAEEVVHFSSAGPLMLVAEDTSYGFIGSCKTTDKCAEDNLLMAYLNLKPTFVKPACAPDQKSMFKVFKGSLVMDYDYKLKDDSITHPLTIGEGECLINVCSK